MLAALEMTQENPGDVLSHEQIAMRTDIGVRTVYRDFPSRTDLLDAVWRESDHRLALTNYPNTEEQLLGFLIPFLSLPKTATERAHKALPMVIASLFALQTLWLGVNSRR